MPRACAPTFSAVDRISTKVIDIVRAGAGRFARRRRPAATSRPTLNPDYRWIKTSGLISPDKWGNLPGGEIFTTPGEVNGTFVIDGVVGDWLCDRYGLLKDAPLTLRIEKQPARRGALGRTRRSSDDFWEYTHTDENSDRVGEFAIGTNIELQRVIGHILQDEKFPGIHIAFGNPYGAHTGADWYSSTHIDVVGTEFDIWVDDEPIMRAGPVPDLSRERCAMIRDAGGNASIASSSHDALRRVHVALLEARVGVPIAVSRSPRRRASSRTSLIESTGRRGAGPCWQQLLDNPTTARAADAVVPPAFRCARARRGRRSSRWISGWCDAAGGIEGRLVELQAFPSLYGFQMRAGARRAATLRHARR